MGDQALDRHAVRLQPPVGLERQHRRRRLGLHVRAPRRVSVDELGVGGDVLPERGGHAADPHHPAARSGQRGQQFSGEREMSEHVRGEDLLVSARQLAGLGRVHDAGVHQQSVETAPRTDRRRGGAHRPEIARVEQERLDGGIRVRPTHRLFREHEPIGVPAGQEHVRARAGQLLAREVAESAGRPGDEVRAAREVGKVPGVPLVARHPSTLTISLDAVTGAFRMRNTDLVNFFARSCDEWPGRCV